MSALTGVTRDRLRDALDGLYVEVIVPGRQAPVRGLLADPGTVARVLMDELSAALPVSWLWEGRPATAVAGRARLALERHGISTVADLAGRTAAELPGEVRRFGPGCLEEVRAALAAAGLSLRGEGRDDTA